MYMLKYIIIVIVIFLVIEKLAWYWLQDLLRLSSSCPDLPWTLSVMNLLIGRVWSLLSLLQPYLKLIPIPPGGTHGLNLVLKGGGRGKGGGLVLEGITFNPLYRALNVLYVIFCIYKNKLARNSIYQFISMLNTSLKIVVCFLWNNLKHIKSVSTVFWLLNHVFSVRYPAFCIFFSRLKTGSKN